MAVPSVRDVLPVVMAGAQFEHVHLAGSALKIDGRIEIVFWALVGVLVGSASGMLWHLHELTLAAGH
jgi:hypothetical protein